ncbi:MULTISPECIES: bactofilin family protein [Halomonadaceae]|uniref:Polymer-forming cytoskeletal protein n=1 Tax=Billgrantia aerodenitrificans TaxID=2733483 RepID=A0ABS9AMF3_9GAMM|nr:MULTISPECIES: polymer-forming cytoskeletal protein [Halomonas]MCE8022985.1 polymer-forming cytoskeletal protein [Halomonas aerodenitrificans]MCE8037717.1 polymer-forming cytoskeletal protein [Halomonas sp. MCCC 1A11062]
MGIQTWFIFLGVAAMTLIVWDGRRRKGRRRAADAGSSTELAAPLPVVQANQQAAVPVSEPTDGAVRAEVRRTVVPHVEEGSRIGMATRVLGNLIAREPVVIKGSIEGAVIAQDHHVMVTMSGRVSSHLEGREVSVDGQVAGVVKAGDKLTLLSRARVEGSLAAERLECLAGAHIRGEVAALGLSGGATLVACAQAEPGLP